jgi:predicted TIM-barrel fold metal-dependent hydrolase
MILDVHAHVGRPVYAYRTAEFSSADLAARMGEAGVSKCCVFSFYDKQDNEYIETTCLLPAGIADSIDDIGAEKYVFGSDAPWGDFEMEILKIKKAARKDRDLELVLGSNLARLLGLES